MDLTFCDWLITSSKEVSDWRSYSDHDKQYLFWRPVKVLQCKCCYCHFWPLILSPILSYIILIPRVLWFIKFTWKSLFFFLIITHWSRDVTITWFAHSLFLAQYNQISLFENTSYLLNFPQVRLDIERKRLRVKWKQLNFKKLSFTWNYTTFYYMASSASGQYAANSVFWFGTRAGKMERYCPPGTARFVPANKISPKFKQVHENFSEIIFR